MKPHAVVHALFFSLLLSACSSTSPSTGSGPVNGAPSGAAATSTATAVPPAAPAGKGVIAGFVFDDRNRSGVADPTEGRLEGQSVQLLNSSGSVTMMSALTDAAGSFRFEHLAPGIYRVALLVPAGFVRTSDNSFELGVETDGTSREARFGMTAGR